MYLLDTNVVSELHKAVRHKGDPVATVWLAQVDLTACQMAAITLMELEIGVLRMERRDVRQGEVLRHWLETFVVPNFADRILPFDSAVARQCARLHVPDRCPERDAQIAATALVHGLTVVTRNVADFAATGVKLLNPWLPSPLQEPAAAYKR